MKRTLTLALLFLASTAAVALAQMQRDQRLRHHFTFHGDRAGAKLGSSIATVGDLDGDRVPDVLVGAPTDSPRNVSDGLVRAYSGRTGEVLWSLRGGIGDRFGASIAALGDVDGDKIPDFAIGAWGGERDVGTDREGYVEFWKGHPRVPTRSAARKRIYGGSKEAFLGAAMCRVPDIDNDGTDDLLVGANQNRVGRGFALLISSTTWKVIHTFRGNAQFSTPMAGLFASSLAAGDMNRDGVPELLIGAPGEGALPGDNNGHVYVFDGKTKARISLARGVRNERIGQSGITVVHDFTRNGFFDFVVGSPRLGRNAAGGGLHLFRLGSLAPSATLQSLAPSASLVGASLAKTDDIDKDGVEDLIVGSAAQGSPGRVRNGTVRFVSMKAFRFLAAPVFEGDSNNDKFCCAVAALGDLDGDGLGEYAIGVPQDDNGGADAGSMRVLSSQSFWFSSDTNAVDTRRGGQQTLRLDLGPSEVGTFYLVLGSLGTRPGIPLGSQTLFLNPDAYFTITTQVINQRLISDSFRRLLGGGRRDAVWTAIPEARLLAGQTLWHAALLFSNSGLRVSRSLPLVLR